MKIASTIISVSLIIGQVLAECSRLEDVPVFDEYANTFVCAEYYTDIGSGAFWFLGSA